MVHTLPSRLQRHFGDYLLLGDSGYPLEPFLMTPVTNPTNEAEELYYRALVRTRVIVELTLGVVKNCFRCIHRFSGELQYTPLRSAKIVSACLLLHNRCVSRSIPDPNNHLPEEDMPIEAHSGRPEDTGDYELWSHEVFRENVTERVYLVDTLQRGHPKQGNNLFPDKLDNFHGNQLKAVTFEHAPSIVDIHDDEGGHTYDGSVVEDHGILSFLSSNFFFRYMSPNPTSLLCNRHSNNAIGTV
ncbi:hypothetical protein Pcinc_009800 [Petrolisthes cinctipes]|uniref:DDE Tnp4 domain-containing protein n=1 Tax=Petrolisthes cinctipes TaxID=88211 RepID=A0AAE1G692_PETCI|nr:hypothetical protein Pcinc_009800 [Petrolisthes cinctipes]